MPGRRGPRLLLWLATCGAAGVAFWSFSGSAAISDGEPRGMVGAEPRPGSLATAPAAGGGPAGSSEDQSASRVPLPTAVPAAPVSPDAWQRSIEHVQELLDRDEFCASLLGVVASTERQSGVPIDRAMASELYDSVVRAASTAHYRRSQDAARAGPTAAAEAQEAQARTDLLFAVLPDLCQRLASRRVEVAVRRLRSGGTGLGGTLARGVDGELSEVRLHLVGGRWQLDVVVSADMVPARLWQRCGSAHDAHERR
ncbi:MAG: hypothetical protein AAF628_10430 [Planctomycetota bacterium]